MSNIKQYIINTIIDLCSDFLYYDRKEDEELSMQDLKNAVKAGEITIDDMVKVFREQLETTLITKQTNNEI